MQNSNQFTKSLNHLNNNKIPYTIEDGVIHVKLDISKWNELWKEDRPLSSL
jgi:hypothetical protein